MLHTDSIRNDGRHFICQKSRQGLLGIIGTIHRNPPQRILDVMPTRKQHTAQIRDHPYISRKDITFCIKHNRPLCIVV